MSDAKPATPVHPLPTLPGYTIHAERSRDRLGVVYQARQLIYAREVALRFVDEKAHAGLRDLSTVRRAARDAGLHVHPGLLPLYDVFENEGRLYLASEVPPEQTLRDRLANKPLPPEEAAALVASVARAVAHLHEHHALHLGLTSACIYLDPGGVPCVGELGLAGLLHNRSSPYPGDPAYAAPEQLAGHEADARADVHALGCVLAECLTGQQPSGRPALSGCPAALARICRKAFEHRPGARYAHAGELADDLDRFRRGEAPPPGAFERLANQVQQLSPVPLLVALFLVVLGGVLGAVWLTGREAAAREEAAQARQVAEQHLQEVRQAEAVARSEAQRQLEKVAAGKAEAEGKVLQAGVDLQRERDARAEERKRREDLRDQLQEEKKRRADADSRARDADTARQDALEGRRTAFQEMDRQVVAQGNVLLETGDLTGALVPFTRALAIAHREKLPEDTHRLRIAALLSRCPRPLCMLRFGKGDVAAVALSPDGKRFLVVGADGVVAAHDAATGARLGKGMVHGAAVTQAIFSPDGRRILSADAMSRVRSWNVEDDKPAFDALTLGSVPVHLGFSGDGKRFATVRQTGFAAAEAQVYDVTTGATIGEAITEQVAPLRPGLSHDGSRLLLCGTDRSARLYDVKTGKPSGPALEHGEALTSATLSSDGRLVLTAGGGIARVHVASTGKQVVSRLEHTSLGIAPQLDEGGQRILTVAGDGDVRVHDTTTGKPVGPTLRSRTTLRQAVLAPDGRSVLLAGVDGVARLFDVSTGQSFLPPLLHSGPLSSAALSPDGARALTFGGLVVRVFDLTAGEPLAPDRVAHPSVRGRGTVSSPDGKWVARSQDNVVQVHDAATGKAVGEALKLPGGVREVRFSPEGDRLLVVSNPAAGATTPIWEARVYETATGKPISQPMEHLREVIQTAFVPGGTRVLTLAGDKKVRVWEGKTGERVGKPMEHAEDVVLVELSPDGRRVITSDKENMTRAWDTATGERVGEGMGHLAPVRALAWSPGGKYLATCSDDGTACVWEIETGKRQLKAEHSGPVTAAAFSPDSGLVVTGCVDGTARAWGLADGKPRTPALPHDDPAHRTAVSADGRWVLTAAGRFVRLWDVRTGEPIVPPLPYASRAVPLNELAFSKAGELITQTGPGTRWVRKLETDSRSDTDLAELAMVLSDREATASGQLVPVEATAFDAAWQQVRGKYRDEFAVPRGRLVAWARRGAAECEARELWGGLLRHLDVLLEAGAQPDLLARRARARLRMGQYEGALADYTKALEKDAGPGEWLAGRGAAAAALGQWERAVADYTAALKSDDRNGDLWRRLGQAEAERGRWKEAAAALTKAVRFSPDEAAFGYEQAVALLSSGDAKGYRAACGRLVRRFGDQKDSAVRRAVADACALGPEAVADYKLLVANAEGAVRASPEDGGEQVRLAALLLRAGQAAQAVMLLEKWAGEGQAGPGGLWLLVLAQQRAGEKEKAKEWQAKASAAKPREGATWTERQTAALWQREAEEALKADR
jgi:WD40 repeat protein/tetratricopeptide (TPR) repeat protein